jgi:pimeloyl-ACP methyl ester carboxylesterase
LGSLQGAITEDDARRYVNACSTPNALRAGFEYHRAIEEDAAENRADMSALEMPVLALGGEHSPWKSYLHEIVRDRCSQVEGEVVPDSGHYVPEERPEWLTGRLIRFFG